MKLHKIVAMILLIASVILAVVCSIVLPGTVITQISTNSDNASTMPKLAAVALPTLLGAGFAVAGLTCDDNSNKIAKYLFVSAVGVVVFIFMLVVNC